MDLKALRLWQHCGHTQFRGEWLTLSLLTTANAIVR